MTLPRFASGYPYDKQMENFKRTPTNSPGLLRKLAVFVATLAIVALVLMFSLLVFAVVLVVGAIAWGFLWWKTRNLRKQMRDYPPGGAVIEGEVIEGEVIRVVNSADTR